MTDQFAIYPSVPRLNEPAPPFAAHSTHGPRSLEDYAGRWLVLFSHPADFTPVCTTEFVAFAQRWPDFQALECDLLGLSVDSVFSHLQWVADIEQRLGVTVPFPILDDSARKVANLYGMIHRGASDTSTVRGTFVIDPDGMLRASSFYPMTTGRSIDEILRLVRALQAAVEHRIATPAEWQPGQDVLRPAPDTLADIADNGGSYLTYRAL